MFYYIHFYLAFIDSFCPLQAAFHIHNDLMLKWLSCLYWTASDAFDGQHTLWKHSLSHLWLKKEGESVILLFVRDQVIFLWPLDIWNTDNRQFSASGRSPIASFNSDKLPEQNCSWGSKWHKHNVKGACGVFWVKAQAAHNAAQINQTPAGGLRMWVSQEACDSDYC